MTPERRQGSDEIAIVHLQVEAAARRFLEEHACIGKVNCEARRDLETLLDRAEDTHLCAVVSESGPNREPLACGFKLGHPGAHAWASLPTFTSGALHSFGEVKTKMSDLERRAEELVSELGTLIAEGYAQSGNQGSLLHRMVLGLEASEKVIEQLLSENRRLVEVMGVPAHLLNQRILGLEGQVLDLRRIKEAAEARVREIAALYDIPDGGRYLNDWKQHRETERQDRDRISAEREAYREALENLWDQAAKHAEYCPSDLWPLEGILSTARRILAEKDR